MSGVLILSSLLIGCAQNASNSQRPAQDVIKDGAKKLAETSSYAFNVSFDGDVSTPAGVETAHSGKISLQSEGAFEGKDVKNLNMNLKLNGSFDNDGKKADGSFEIRLAKNTVYFTIAKLNSGDQQMDEQLKTYLGKWYSYPIPAAFLNQLQDLTSQSASGQLTPEQQKMKTLFEKTNFLSQPVYVAEETIGEEASAHFKANLDKKAVVEFAKQVAEIQGRPAGEEEIDRFAKMLDQLQTSNIDVWVGNNSGVLNQVLLSFKSTQPAQTVGSVDSDSVDSADQFLGGNNGSISLKITLNNFNKPLTIEVPKDATVFPLFDFVPSAE